MKSLEVPKAIIKKIDKYEIHLDGDNSYASAKTLEEAQKIAEKMEKEARIEWENQNSEETKRKLRLEALSRSIDNYIAMLKQELWQLQHFNGKTETTKVIIENLKDTIKNLKGFSEGKLSCNWHNGYLGSKDSYSIDEVKED